MSYPVAAVERAMTIHQAILHALHGRQTWLQVADVLGLNPRTVRRWRWKFERDGVNGLLDRRRQTPSTRRVPVVELQRVLRLYRARYTGFTRSTPPNGTKAEAGSAGARPNSTLKAGRKRSRR